MDKFFDQPAWLQLVTMAILFLALSTILAVLWMLIKAILNFFQGKTIQSSVFSVSDAKNVSFEENDEETVETAVEYVNLLLLQNHAMSQIWKIKEIDILRDQMSYIEDRIDLLSSKFEKLFIEEKIKQNGTEKQYLFTPEYFAFKMLTEVIRGRLVSKVRTMCKENHFLEKNDKEFKEYVSIHVQIIADAFYYSVNMYSPTVPFLCSGIITIMLADVSECTKELIYKAREISADKDAQIKSIQNEFDAQCIRILGHTIKGVI